MPVTPPPSVHDNAPTSNVDGPPESYAPPASSADMLTDELDPPFPIVDRGFGPTDIGKAFSDEEMAKEGEGEGDAEDVDESTEAATEDKPEDDDTPPPSDATREGDVVKESPKTVPYDRFREIVAENQRLKQSSQVLDWIMKNPEQAAARLGAKTAPPQPKHSFIDIEEPKPHKPIDEMDETERAQLWVEQRAYNYLKRNLEKIDGAFSDLFGFKEQLSETLTKNAVDKDGKPLHPRWDELRPTMHEIKGRYSGMSDVEAYHLADRMVPQSTPMGDEMAMYNEQPRPQPRPQQAAPVPPKPKRASPAALRAAKVASFGRSTPGTASIAPDRYSPEQAAEKAFEEILANERT